jgi:ribonuclease Z
MITTRISRIVVALASMVFAGVALAIWTAPAQAARMIGLEPFRAAGAAVVGANIGGLFAGLALLCGAAAWTRQSTWSLAAGAILGVIVLGRGLGWISSGQVGSDVPELLIELTLIAALFLLARGDRPSVYVAPRRNWRPIVLASALGIVALAGTIALANPSVQQRMFDAAAAKRAATINAAPLADDALRVAICGSSAPLPSRDRAKACVAVFAGGKFYIVDAGPESVENLVTWGIPLSAIGGVLLTHFHSDHIGDLGELNLQTWAAGRPNPLTVYGGPGIDRVVNGFNDAYRLDQGYRTAHHTEKVMPPSTWPMVSQTVAMENMGQTAGNRRATVLQDSGLTITAIEVDHTPISPAYAYRFDYKGRSVFITGDLKFQPTLADAVRGADLLVSEAIAVQMTRALGSGAQDAGRSQTAAIMHDIEDYHITPEQAAAIANEAKVKLLVFSHLLPAPDGALARRVFAQGIDEVRRDGWTMADDGSVYTLPLQSDAVRIGTLVD